MKKILITKGKFKVDTFEVNKINFTLVIKENVKNFKKLTENTWYNFNKLLTKKKYTGTEFKKMVRNSISCGKNTGAWNISYWLWRGYTRKQSKIKILEIQKNNCSKRFEKYTKEEIREQNLKSHKGLTLEIYRERSIRCIEYWLKKGFSVDESKEKIRSVCDTSLTKMIKKYGEEEGQKKYQLKILNLKRSSKRCIEYWLQQGYDNQTAKTKLSEHQSTFSLEKCMEKHGKEEGYKIWKDRQERWQDTMNNKSDEEKREINKKRFPGYKKNYFMSEAERNLCESLNCNSQLYLNGFWYDLYKGNKIIEYNGDYFHCNPDKYNIDFYNKSIKMYAGEKWEYDKIKTEQAIKNGYDVLIIWEHDYKKDPELTIKKCSEFLENRG
jgi:hypothetical protein